MSDTPTHRPGQSPVPGGQLGRYTLESPIGAGGMAAVYRARDENGTRVAVKVLHPESIKPDEIKRFKREFDALSKMNHPNIVRVYEAGVADGYPWIAIEYVDGTDLGTLIETWKLKPLADHFQTVERYLRKMCLALQYIHEQGLVHRDIKPTNILVRSDGEIKISDFGGVKDPEATGTQLTVAGQLIGTVAFMSPEQITGENIDRRTDLYSLGALLYIMLTFKRPIEANSVAGFLARHLTEVPKAPSEINPAIPRRLEQVCQRMLMKDPSLRFSSARMILQALDTEEPKDRPPIRGRAQSLNQWNEQLRVLKEGAGGSLAVLGPEGSGRSFLLQEMLAQARSQGFKVAFSPGRNPNPITEMLRDIGEQVHEVPTKKHLRWLAERIRGGQWVLGVDDLDSANPKMVDAYCRLLKKLVSNEGETVLLVYSCRSKSNFLEPLMAGTESGIPSEIIPIQSLARKHVLTMLRDRGLDGPIVNILARRLHSSLNGLPAPICQQFAALIEAEWLRREGTQVIPIHSRESFRNDPLPIPLSIRKKLAGRLAQLNNEEMTITEVMAVLDRPASPGLLGRATERPTEIRFHLENLSQAGVLRAIRAQDELVFDFAHPCMASVMVGDMSPDQKRSVHHAISIGLGSPRRDPKATRELAEHLKGSGQLAKAFPLYIRAARGMNRKKKFNEVIVLCDEADKIRKLLDETLPREELLPNTRWLFMLKGEALLAKGVWEEATEPLQRAVHVARELNDTEAASRCLASLGRAHYRLGRFDHASPLLEEALALASTKSRDRSPATRALADILVRRGEFDRAERLWKEALHQASQGQQRDSEARARRGLAHVKAFQGQLGEAAELLDQADDLLNPDGNPRVRAGVMARSIELDLASARYGSALYRCDTLVELAHIREMDERLAEAYALTAKANLRAGQRVQAESNVNKSLNFIQAQRDPSLWMARLTSSRVYCDLQMWDEADKALPKPEELRNNALDDPSAQLAALRARRIAHTDPKTASDLCSWCLLRPVPSLIIRHIHICTDVCLALGTAGDIEGARKAAKRGLKALTGTDCDGLRLDLLIAFHTVAPDPRILATIGQVTKRIALSLPPNIARTMLQRPIIKASIEQS